MLDTTVLVVVVVVVICMIAILIDMYILQLVAVQSGVISRMESSA